MNIVYDSENSIILSIDWEVLGKIKLTGRRMNSMTSSQNFYVLLTVHLSIFISVINPLNAELNPMCHLLALLGAHHILHVSGIRVNELHAQNFCFTISLFHASICFEHMCSKHIEA